MLFILCFLIVSLGIGVCVILAFLFLSFNSISCTLSSAVPCEMSLVLTSIFSVYFFSSIISSLGFLLADYLSSSGAVYVWAVSRLRNEKLSDSASTSVSKLVNVLTVKGLLKE